MFRKQFVNRWIFNFEKEVSILQEMNIFFGLINLFRTCIVGKPMATKKFAHQLIKTATDIAAGLGPWENSSAVIIQGMEPGPTAKNTT